MLIRNKLISFCNLSNTFLFYSETVTITTFNLAT